MAPAISDVLHATDCRIEDTATLVHRLKSVVEETNRCVAHGRDLIDSSRRTLRDATRLTASVWHQPVQILPVGG